MTYQQVKAAFDQAEAALVDCDLDKVDELIANYDKASAALVEYSNDVQTLKNKAWAMQDEHSEMDICVAFENAMEHAEESKEYWYIVIATLNEQIGIY